VEKRLPLVIIGNETDYSRQIFDYADRINLTDYLVVPSYVHTNDLPAIYQGAQVFIYMSFYEGFGLPIMEAIASGVPVVVSKTSAMPEAAGPGGALADPRDPAEVASKISEFMWDETAREGAIKSGFVHVKKFGHLEVSRSLISMYEEVAKKSAI
jgi:glycosyltransferase involved in cell wall biosynthesis